MRLRFQFLGLILLGLLAGACQGELNLDIQVNDDGSGVVTFTVLVDDEFVDTFGSLNDLVLEDVVAAGWTVEVAEAATGEQVSVSKPFADMQDLPAVVAELDADAEGLFQDVALVRTEQRDQVTYELSMTLDLSQLVEQLSDPQLTARLDGRPFGYESADLDRLAGGSLEAATTVSVHVDLVGKEFETSETLESGELIAISVENVIVDAEALELRDEAESKRNMAALVGVVFVVGLFIAWLLLRGRGEYADVDEYGYGYEDDYEDGYSEEYADGYVEEYEPNAVGYVEYDESYQEVPPAQSYDPVAAGDDSQPAPNEVWVDGVGWVAPDAQPEAPVEPEAIPGTETHSESLQSESGQMQVGGVDTDDVAVAGGSVSFGASTPEPAEDDQPGEPPSESPDRQ